MGIILKINLSYKEKKDSYWIFEMMMLHLSHKENDKCGFKIISW